MTITDDTRRQAKIEIESVLKKYNLRLSAGYGGEIYVESRGESLPTFFGGEKEIDLDTEPAR